MFFGSNLQFLRRRGGLTQEQLAQQMGVSRQTVSKWESGQAPELSKLLELADLFHCPLDDLLRQDLSLQDSAIRVIRLKGFSMARYTILSPNAEVDLRSWMDGWADRSGLLAFPGYPPAYLSWSFPYVSGEQKNRFGLSGFCGAYVLPKGFVPSADGPEICTQEDCCYAVMSFPEPGGRDSRQISRCIQAILEYLREAGIPKAAAEGCLPCFEWRYEKDETPWVSLFLQCRSTETAEVFSFETL